MSRMIRRALVGETVFLRGKVAGINDEGIARVVTQGTGAVDVDQDLLVHEAPVVNLIRDLARAHDTGGTLDPLKARAQLLLPTITRGGR